MILVADIQRLTAEHYGLPLDRLKGRSRMPGDAHPRHVAMCLSRRLTEHSTVVIGRIFRRDHSTIITGSAAAELRCVNDPEVAEALRSVTMRLLAEAGH